MTISMDKKYTTRDGHPVELDAVGKTFAVGTVPDLFERNGGPHIWRVDNGFVRLPDGTYQYGSINNLIPAPEEVTLWVNVYQMEPGVYAVGSSDSQSEATTKAINRQPLGVQCVTTVPITFKVPG